MDMLDSDLIIALEDALRGELPGSSAHLEMAPAFRHDPGQLSVRGKPCRHAAVLVVLYPKDDGVYLILTLRTDDLPDHPGQISFPGGRQDPGEELQETALREAREEIGLDSNLVNILGELSPLYIAPSNFCVHPFVAVCDTEPELAPLEDEVAAVLHVPLASLFDRDASVVETWSLRGEIVDIPCIRFHQYRIWGATAMMLSELRAVLTRIPAEGCKES